MSAKTVAEKLKIKPSASVWSSDEAKLTLIGSFPEGVRFVPGPGQATTALIFVDDEASARATLDTNKDQLHQPGAVWVIYPKGNKTDVNRDTLWPILLEYGMRPVSQVAVDNLWSALRFRPLKAGETFFTVPAREGN